MVCSYGDILERDPACGPVPADDGWVHQGHGPGWQDRHGITTLTSFWALFSSLASANAVATVPETVVPITCCSTSRADWRTFGVAVSELGLQAEITVSMKELARYDPDQKWTDLTGTAVQGAYVVDGGSYDFFVGDCVSVGPVWNDANTCAPSRQLELSLNIVCLLC